MLINQALKKITEELDGTLACSIVDLSSGIILGVHHTIPYFTQAYIDAVAAAAVDIFRGRNVYAVEQMLAIQRGEEIAFHTQEVQITSTSTYHFIAIIPEKPDMLYVLVTNKKVNIGLGWASAHRACKQLASLCI